MMTRKDYKAIAAIIAQTHTDAKAGAPTEEARLETLAAIECIAMGLACHCAADNPRFDRDRFYRACFRQ